ncbi:MAG TPA: ThuA domain-containing protein [Candidatus Ruania gallistercoris]|uniref:ThuA domain-containing protein n=1 Tax=Candidatus Ruania gallistercoris TaxID=2838746 RepID=A0A9D2J6G7_9MICO|nr:ThuA domain-containing protein [Candidatus Ruania gallistercoris]
MTVASAPPRRALVVRGGWDGHVPVAATDLFVPFLREAGFAVDLHHDLDVYTDAATMAGTDLIVQCWTMGTITADQVRGLRTAVENGTGLAGWHGGIADSFRASSAYLHLIGGQFATHPALPEEQRSGGSADNFLTHTVQITGDHPIVAGIEDFELTTEQYWVLTDDLIDVHASTTHPARADQPWHREVTCPAVWTRQWGTGRIFVATPGHSVDVLEHPSVRTIIERGLLWAAR